MSGLFVPLSIVVVGPGENNTKPANKEAAPHARDAPHISE